MPSATSSSNIIKFENVDLVYPGTHALALSDLSFGVNTGEFFCIVGPSGCGKSTVLKIIADLEQPTGGQVIKPKQVGMVFQSGALLPWLNVYDNVAMALRAQGAHERKIEEESLKYIEMTGLTPFAEKYP